MNSKQKLTTAIAQKRTPNRNKVLVDILGNIFKGLVEEERKVVREFERINKAFYTKINRLVLSSMINGPRHHHRMFYPNSKTDRFKCYDVVFHGMLLISPQLTCKYSSPNNSLGCKRFTKIYNKIIFSCCVDLFF